jgi:hypothetical protein
VLVVPYESIGFEGPEETLNALANYYAQVEALKMSEFAQYRDKDISDVSPRQSLSSESARSSFEAVQSRFKPSSGLLKSNASQTDMRPSIFDVNSNSLDVQRKSSLYEHVVGSCAETSRFEDSGLQSMLDRFKSFLSGSDQ